MSPMSPSMNLFGGNPEIMKLIYQKNLFNSIQMGTSNILPGMSQVTKIKILQKKK